MGDLFADEEDFIAEFLRSCVNADVKEAEDDFDPDSFDRYLSMELSVDRGGEYPKFSKVTKRLKDHRVNPIGTSYDNPILDSRMHEVECHDGSKQTLSANTMTENMFANLTKKVMCIYYYV